MYIKKRPAHHFILYRPSRNTLTAGDIAQHTARRTRTDKPAHPAYSNQNLRYPPEEALGPWLPMLERQADMSRLMTKPTKWSVRPAKPQIRLGGCIRWAHMPFCWFCHEAAPHSLNYIGWTHISFCMVFKRRVVKPATIHHFMVLSGVIRR